LRELALPTIERQGRIEARFVTDTGFKERMEPIVHRHGKDIEFYGYNREDLGDDGLPPLNTEAGQAWLKREIAAIKPDLIIFDSIMCLLIGSMSEEATWMPVRPCLFTRPTWSNVLVLLAGVILAPRRTATPALRILGRDHDRIDPFAARPSLQ
jgi:hypothetical protein